MKAEKYKASSDSSLLERLTIGIVLRKQRLEIGVPAERMAAALEMSIAELDDLERGRADWNEDLVAKYIVMLTIPGAVREFVRLKKCQKMELKEGRKMMAAWHRQQKESNVRP